MCIKRERDSLSMNGTQYSMGRDMGVLEHKNILLVVLNNGQSPHMQKVSRVRQNDRLEMKDER